VGDFFTDAISRPCCEGPALLRAPPGAAVNGGPGGRGWILIFDQYRDDCTLFGAKVGSGGGSLLLGGADGGEGGGDGGCGLIGGRPVAEMGLVAVEESAGPEEAPEGGGGNWISEGGAGDPISVGGAGTPKSGRCAYRPARKGLGALMSSDLRTWHDVSGRVSAPPGYKHGTVVELPPRALHAVCSGRC